MKCANDNGYSIIRILQDDIYNNRYDWLSEIITNIEKLTTENKVQNIYMCKKNEYKDFDI
jgi:very-short-patch-repair endonuclease